MQSGSFFLGRELWLYRLTSTPRLWLRKALNQRRSVTSWPTEAFSRAQFHLSRVLLARGRPQDSETAARLREKALAVLHTLLPLDKPPELDGVTDETILFDHMLPVCPGGPRFTGLGLLQCFMSLVEPPEHWDTDTTLLPLRCQSAYV